MNFLMVLCEVSLIKEDDFVSLFSTWKAVANVLCSNVK